MSRFIVAVWLVMASGVSYAANPLNGAVQAAATACVAKSKLDYAWADGPSTMFQGNDLLIALLIRGVKPPPAMKKQAGAELCLYSLETQSARLTEWDAMADTGSPLRPLRAAPNL